MGKSILDQKKDEALLHLFFVFADALSGNVQCSMFNVQHSSAVFTQKSYLNTEH